MRGTEMIEGLSLVSCFFAAISDALQAVSNHVHALV